MDRLIGIVGLLLSTLTRQGFRALDAQLGKLYVELYRRQVGGGSLAAEMVERQNAVYGGPIAANIAALDPRVFVTEMKISVNMMLDALSKETGIPKDQLPEAVARRLLEVFVSMAAKAIGSAGKVLPGSAGQYITDWGRFLAHPEVRQVVVDAPLNPRPATREEVAALAAALFESTSAQGKFRERVLSDLGLN